MRILRGVYISYGFFIALLALVVVFCVGFVYPIFFIVGQGGVALLAAILVLEIVVLFGKKRPVSGVRRVANQLSMGDENRVALRIRNNYNFPIRALIYDNAPVQLQLRNLHFSDFMSPVSSA